MGVLATGLEAGHRLLKMRLQQGPGLRGSAERTGFSGPAFLPSRELLLFQVELGVHQRGSPQKSGPAVLPRDRVLHGGAHAEEPGAHWGGQSGLHCWAFRHVWDQGQAFQDG